MLKKYRIGFDVWGLLLFLIIMIPNILWFAIPAPNDILRTDSSTKPIDAVASVCQVLMVVTLCIVVNREKKKMTFSPIIIAVLLCCLAYFVCWGCYYAGAINPVVILGLTIPPCIAFLLLSIERKNVIAVIPIVLFTVCHLIYAVINFLI
ncbi:MAG: hypothetical protein DIU81_009265 [[Clostridium] cellulosi]